MTCETSNPIVLISDDSRVDTRLRMAFERTEPRYSLGVVQSRKEFESLCPPNLILLDLLLSEEPAFHILKWLRADQRYDGVPVIAIGSEVVQHDVDEAYALGVNSCFLNTREPEGLDRIAQGIASYAALLREAAQVQ